MIFRFGITTVLIGLISCGNNAEMNEFIPEDEVKAEGLHSNIIKDVSSDLAPLNCPVIFKIDEINQKNKVTLRIAIRKNKDFNPKLNDECEGDLKNLWKDLKRIKFQLDGADVDVFYISNILNHSLDYFPFTKNEIKVFINNQASQSNLKNKLSKYNPKELNSSLNIQRDIRLFMPQAIQSYLDEHHKIILEEVLENHVFNGQNYSAGKYQYCYDSFNRCEYLGNLENYDKDPSLDFEFFGVGADWWGFMPRNNTTVKD